MIANLIGEVRIIREEDGVPITLARIDHRGPHVYRGMAPVETQEFLSVCRKWLDTPEVVTDGECHWLVRKEADEDLVAANKALAQRAKRSARSATIAWTLGLVATALAALL